MPKFNITHNKNYNESQKGVIMIMAAVFVTVMLILAATSFFILQRATAKEQWGSVWNLVGLAGMQEYFEIDCETLNLSGAACHAEKFENAIVRMQEIADANSHLVTSLDVFEAGGSEPTGNFLEVTPGRYYYQKVDNEDFCAPDPYPCFKSMDGGDPNELANALKIRGKVKHGRLTKFVFNSFVGSSKDLDLEVTRTIAAVPLAIAIVIDLSPSVQRINHSHLQNPAPTDPKNSNFAYEVDYSSGSGFVTPSTLETEWNALEATRPPENKPATFHYKDDYLPVAHYNDQSDYNVYLDNTHHIEPLPAAQSVDQYFLIDGHRSAVSGYLGPEPYFSIIKGARKALDLMEARNVSGDSVTFVAYNSGVPWRYGIKRTTKFDYLKEVLNGEDISDGDLHPGYPLPPPPSNYPIILSPRQKTDPNVPLWVRLGLFPTPGKWTDTLQGLSMAVSQMGIGLGEVPTVKAILHFTDGVVNCSSTLQSEVQSDGYTGRCRDAYNFYTEGMLDLRRMVQDDLAESGISLHTFMVGNAAHYLAIPANAYTSNHGYGPEANPNRCLSDEELRGINVNMVNSANYADASAGQLAFSQKNEVPFYQAAYDSYILTKMTGGRWGALLPVADNCVPNELDCSDPDVAWQKVLSDPLCRTIEEQVNDYIEDVILNSKTFAVVE